MTSLSFTYVGNKCSLQGGHNDSVFALLVITMYIVIPVSTFTCLSFCSKTPSIMIRVFVLISKIPDYSHKLYVFPLLVLLVLFLLCGFFFIELILISGQCRFPSDITFSTVSRTRRPCFGDFGVVYFLNIFQKVRLTIEGDNRSTDWGSIERTLVCQ